MTGDPFVFMPPKDLLVTGGHLAKRTGRGQYLRSRRPELTTGSIVAFFSRFRGADGGVSEFFQAG